MDQVYGFNFTEFGSISFESLDFIQLPQEGLVSVGWSGREIFSHFSFEPSTSSITG